MKHNLRNSFALNLGLVTAIAILIYILFFVTLSYLTHQGEKVLIPDVRGKDAATAINLLKSMNFIVQVDSTYELSAKPFAVLKQIPEIDTVKSGRTIFLTVNKAVPPLVAMPNLVGVSYRSAELLLRNSKLRAGDTIVRPDNSGGEVLEQMYKGSVIRPGEMVAMGSKITLVIGNGKGLETFDVPELTKIPYDEALTRLLALNIQPRLIVKEGTAITDTYNAYVICQYPRPINNTGEKNKINAGESMELIIVQNPTEDDYFYCKIDSNRTSQ
jgi:eukaryotic-like serine/threonine-protein kinase